MSFDAHANFAISTVATAPSPADTGSTLDVASGEGSRFPTPPFNATVWPANAQPDPTNSTIVRVTAMSGDSITAMTRDEEGSAARSIQVGDQIAAGITAKTLTDVESSAGAHRVRTKKTTATQTIASGGADLVAINWDGVDYDTDAFWASANPSRLTIPTGLGGLYHISFYCTIGSTTGVQEVGISVNGTTPSSPRMVCAATSGFASQIGVSGDFLLNAGDYVEGRVYQTSGSTATPGANDACLTLRKVGTS